MARNVLIFLVVGGVSLLLCPVSSGDIPRMISYQGKLITASGGCLNDTVQMTFSIYPDTLGSPADWSETQTAVVVKEGIFSVLLGSVDTIPAAVFDGSIKYLGVQVEPDPEMRPLKPMVSVAYAYRAGAVDGGGEGGGWVDDGIVVRLESSTDNVGIGTSGPAGKLDVTGPGLFRRGDGIQDKIILNPEDPNVAIELRSETSGGTPFIDFANDDATDFDARIRLKDDGLLTIEGTQTPTFEVDGKLLVTRSLATALGPSEDSVDLIRGYYTYRGAGVDPFEYQGSVLQARTTYGGDFTNPVGTVHAINGHVRVLESGDSQNEMTPLFLDLSADASARLWGVDLNVHGPVTAQADLIQGLVNLVNNYSGDAIPNKGLGAAIVTRAGSGGGDVAEDRSTRQTYPLDIGLAIVGWSGTPDQLTKTQGYETALQIGGNASGWMGTSETSKIGTGVLVTDVETAGIKFQDFLNSSTPALSVDVPSVMEISEADSLKWKFSQEGSGVDATLLLRDMTEADEWWWGAFAGGDKRLSFQKDGMVVMRDSSVGIGTTTPAEKLDVAGTARMTGFKMPTGAVSNYVLTSDASGVGTWQPAMGGADIDWSLNLSDGNDTTLTTGGAWGIARYGNTLYGNADSTHINLGVACTTGTSAGRKYCTVGGGLGNAATGERSTIAGGASNRAAADDATVGGGWDNTASEENATVAGGAVNAASAWAATVAGGYLDTASGSFATVAGGRDNTASGDSSTVGGGSNNTASADAATVGGGAINFAIADRATVSGGAYNNAIDFAAAVGGGTFNVAAVFAATVGGGMGNLSGDTAATVGGGSYNKAWGKYSVVAGGGGSGSDSNSALGNWSTIGGGVNNVANNDYSIVAGGQLNTASGSYSNVGGGQNNEAGNVGTTVAGGVGNYAGGYIATIGGGNNNNASGRWSTVAGGASNTAEDTAATVGGGRSNTADSLGATVGGGENNSATKDWATVGGGLNNVAGGGRATVAGGQSNEATGPRATVGGGYLNVASAFESTVGGGAANVASHTFSTVSGGLNDTASGEASTVGGGQSNKASSLAATVGGGQDNIASGSYSTVPGGYLNEATGNYSFAAGRQAIAYTNNTFVWNDGSTGYFSSTDAYQFLIGARGGVGIGTSDPGTSALKVTNDFSGSFGQMVYFQSVSDPSSDNDMLAIDAPSTAPDGFQFIECARGTDTKFWVNGNGDVYADGAYNKKGSESAEMIVVSAGASTVEPGDVMVIDPNSPRAIVKSSESRSTLVAGIFSTKPGFIGSERDWNKPSGREEPGTYTLKEMAAEFNEIPLAVVGIVPCKVSAENGPIRPGDLLVTSGAPGRAMRDDNPKVGTVLGKALGSLSSGSGVIKVLVTLH